VSEAPPHAQPNAGSPGAMLLSERRRQNLSLGDVSRQLKLSVRQVEALERDDFSAFQGPVFVHGFIRNYAKLLAVDPAPLVSAADRLLLPVVDAVEDELPAVRERLPASGARFKWPVAAIAAAVAAGIALLALYPREDAKRATGPGPAAQVATVVTSGERRTTGKGAERPESTRVRREASAAKGPPTGTAVVVEPRAASASETQRDHGRASADQSQGDAQSVLSDSAAEVGDAVPRKTLRMIFEQESWVEVKDRNGTTVFGQLNAAGTRRSASGEPPLTVVVGNAAGVRLFIGDQGIDLAPHTRVDVARLTVE
jgi:cytoskeleton protein RodZ